MRELAYILLGIAITAVIVPLFILLAHGLAYVSINPSRVHIPVNTGGGSSTFGKIIRKIFGKITIKGINYDKLGFNIPNKSILNETVFIVYGQPGSTYGYLTYFEVATYSTFKDGTWIVDKSGKYSTKLVSRCPYGICTTSCYTIEIVHSLNYLPHNGYPFIVRTRSGTGTILYNKWTNMLKGDVKTYSLCVYVPHPDLYKMFNIPLSSYKNISARLRIYLQISSTIRDILYRKFRPLLKGCRTLRCVIYRILQYIELHYTYTRYIEIPESVNPVKYLLHLSSINCLGANTLLVLTLRSFGIPARLVAGFVGSPYSERQEIKLYYAHAWSQVYVPNVGWVIVDATPGIAGEFINMLRTNTTNILRVNISRLDITSIPSKSTILGEIIGRDLTPGIYPLYVTYLDYYLSNNTWIRKKVGYYSCNEIDTLEMLIENNFIRSKYLTYSISLEEPLRYVPHIDYAIEAVPGSVNPESNEILSNGGEFFIIKSIKIDRNSIHYLLNIPLKTYSKIDVPEIFLELPNKDRLLLKKVAENITGGCRTLRCVVEQIYFYVIRQLNSANIVPEKSGRGSTVDIVRRILENENVTITSTREYFDIANTLVVLLLRAVGIPSRLAVGFQASVSRNVGVIRSYIVTWPQIYIPVGHGLWLDMPYQPLLALLVSGEMYYNNATLTIIRGGKWKCYTIYNPLIYTTTYASPSITVNGVPRDVNYRVYVSYSNGAIKYIRICLHAGKNAPLGHYTLVIKLLSNNPAEFYIDLLIKARTFIYIDKIYPKYVAPGSRFIVQGVLENDKGVPIPNMTVYIYVMNHKNGNIITTCIGRTLKNGTFRVECYVPQNEPKGRYYIEAVFKGSELYTKSRADPYIYVTNRPRVELEIPASCTMIGNSALLCLTNRDNLQIVIRGNERIIEKLEIRGYGDTRYSIGIENNKAVILLRDVRRDILTVEYPGSVEYSYFNLLLKIYKLNVATRLVNCSNKRNYICYRNSLIKIYFKNRIPGIAYRLYIYEKGPNETRIQRTVSRENYTISLRSLRPGTWRILIYTSPVPSIGQTQIILSRSLPTLRDPPLLRVIDLKNVEIFSRTIKIVSRIGLNDVHILYSIPLLLSFHVIISGKVVDYYTGRPVNATVCAYGRCVRVLKGEFSILVPLYRPIIDLYIYPLSKFYTRTRRNIAVPLLVFSAPFILYSVICGVLGFSVFKVYETVRKRRRRILIFYGSDRTRKVRGLIKFLDIGPEEPPVWGLNEPLHIEVEAYRESERVPEQLLRVRIDDIYSGIGRIHSIVFDREGEYTVELYVEDSKICDATIRVVDYRLEIGRIFKDVIEKNLGEDSRFLTPRQIMMKLVEKGVPYDIARRVVNIHEKVIYGGSRADRRTFLEFVTLIKYIDHKYNLAGVPQTEHRSST